MQAKPSVAIVGGGASGLFAAVQLLNRSEKDGFRVYLIEKHDTFGFGAAFATNDPSHLLNVRAGNMSAFPDKPNHFLEWLQENAPHQALPVTPSSFVSRQTYGRYLRSLLHDAATCDEAAGRFYLVPDEAVSIRPLEHGRYCIRLAVGKEIEADCVVLAVGNPPPHPPGVSDNSVLASPHYIGDPWSGDLSSLAPKAGTILLLGTGLTMVDATLSLFRGGHRGPMIGLSRRGLWPRRHMTGQKAGAHFTPPSLTSNLLTDLRAVRQAVRREMHRGGDWRDVIDAFRPITAEYWRGLSQLDRQRFLRHLRSWWDVHRHRLAPEVADKIDALVAAGVLGVKSGRLKDFTLTGREDLPVLVTWQPKGSKTLERIAVSKIINCMGPGNNPRQSSSPLMRQIVADGLVEPHPLGLGLSVDTCCRLIARSGEVAPTLFALGPVTRGAFWEVTAIPDIREKAAEVATTVLSALYRDRHKAT